LRPLELEAGFGVERQVSVGGESYSTSEFLHWLLADHVHKTVLLENELGEGKTTFLYQVVMALQQDTLLLWWRPEDQPVLNLEGLRLASRHVAKYAPQSRGMLVLGEVLSYSASEVALRIECGLRDQELPCSVLLAGCPNSLARLGMISSRRAALDSLNEHGASTLADRIVKACSLLKGDPAVDWDWFPNVKAYTGLSASERTQVLLSADGDGDGDGVSTKSLLAKLLTATYGQHLVERIRREADNLDQQPREIYRHLCLATAADLSLSVDAIRALVGTFSLNHEQFPWISDDSGFRARNRIIARSLVEWMSGSIRSEVLTTNLHAWCDGLLAGSLSQQLVRQVIEGCANWVPVDRTNSSARGRIKRAVRRSLRQRFEDLDSLAGVLGADSRCHLDWSRVLYLLHPKKLEERHGFLLNAEGTLLQQAKTLGLQQDETLRVEYYLDKVARNQSRIRGQETSADDRFKLIQKWYIMEDQRLWGPDFYVDMFGEATTLARGLIYSSSGMNQGVDSEKLVFCFEVAMSAYEHFRALTGQVASNELTYSYSAFVSRDLCYAPLKAHLVGDLLEKSWRLSLALRVPNPQTGNMWAEWRENKFDEKMKARDILVEVIKTCPNWGESYLTLARLSPDDALQHCAAAVANEQHLSGLSRALVYHAYSLLESDPSQKACLLRMAAENYAESLSGEPEFEHRKSDWLEVCRLLKKADDRAGVNCLKQYNQAVRTSGGAPKHWN